MVKNGKDVSRQSILTKENKIFVHTRKKKLWTTETDKLMRRHFVWNCRQVIWFVTSGVQQYRRRCTSTSWWLGKSSIQVWRDKNFPFTFIIFSKKASIFKIPRLGYSHQSMSSDTLMTSRLSPKSLSHLRSSHSAVLRKSLRLASEFQKDGRTWVRVHVSTATRRKSSASYVIICALGLKQKQTALQCLMFSVHTT